MQHRPKRSLGQNFLQDEHVIARIVASLKLKPQDTVIEIGPGLGALTRELIGKARNVIAIEFDRDMVLELRSSIGHSPDLNIINTDALSVDFEDLIGNAESTKVVANLPYNISTAILQRLIEQRGLFNSLVLMFQKEVVDRIVASPGNTERGFLTVLTENAFLSERLFDVPPEAFFPAPKVQSSVVRLTPRPGEVDEVLLTRIASAAFQQKRKTLHNNLKETPYYNRLATTGIDGRRRAETLTNLEWQEIVKAAQNKK
jgi:16S rRNA (adenine1518-N6/adenine1519-N6)-dimethyltransferase